METIHLANIAPKSFTLEALDLSPKVYMGLQHLCAADPGYAVTLSRRDENTYLFLDNSYFELGKACSIDDLIEAGNHTKANCLILPDGDLNGLDVVKRGGFDAMYIPMHIESNPSRYIKDIIDALRNPDIDYVGISYLHATKYTGKDYHKARSGLFVELLPALKSISTAVKKLHILGGTTPDEFIHLSKYSRYINSWDTSMAFNAAIRDISLDTVVDKLPAVNLFEVNHFTLGVLKRSYYNVGYLNGLLRQGV